MPDNYRRTRRQLVQNDIKILSHRAELFDEDSDDNTQNVLRGVCERERGKRDKERHRFLHLSNEAQLTQKSQGESPNASL